MMVKQWISFLFSLLTVLAFGQDTLNFEKTSCSIQLKQIRPHINGAYIGLDYDSRLLILDSSFNVKNYGPYINYINLNDYQSPLQLIAVSNDNSIIYLDQNLSINRTINLNSPAFIRFISPTSNSQIWINLNNQITLYDPFFKSIIEKINTPNISMNDIKSVNTIQETLYVMEEDVSYEFTHNNKTKHKHKILGVIEDHDTVYSYTNQQLITQTSFYTLPFKSKFIHIHNNLILGIDKEGALHKSIINR